MNARPTTTEQGMSRRGALRSIGFTFASLCTAGLLNSCKPQQEHKPPYSSITEKELSGGLPLVDKQKKLIEIRTSSEKLQKSFDQLRSFVDLYASKGESIFQDDSLLSTQADSIRETKSFLVDMQDKPELTNLKNYVGSAFTALTDLEYHVRIRTKSAEVTESNAFGGIDAALDAEEKLELMLKVLKADALALEHAKEKDSSASNGGTASHGSTIFYPYYMYYGGFGGEGYGYSRTHNFSSQGSGIQSRLSNSSRLSPGRTGTSGKGATSYRAGSGSSGGSSSGFSGSRSSGGFGGRGASGGG